MEREFMQLVAAKTPKRDFKDTRLCGDEGDGEFSCKSAHRVLHYTFEGENSETFRTLWGLHIRVESTFE